MFFRETGFDISTLFLGLSGYTFPPIVEIPKSVLFFDISTVLGGALLNFYEV